MSKLGRRLPWLVAIGSLALYGVTLSHGMTINSLDLASQVAGWNSMPVAGRPLLWLLTLPMRLLPAAVLPSALNFFSAITAALTLGLLARSVQLLPWDLPWAERKGWAMVLPVLLACGVCGLEFSFWQEATAASGEMLDLLLLSASLWLLLEYRVSRKPRWLDAAAFVWGLGMAENWLMLLALPLFAGGIIWIHGLRLFVRHRTMEEESGDGGWLDGLRWFRLDLVSRLAVLGLAGFSCYALLPMASGLAPGSPWTLGQAWHANLKQTKDIVMMVYVQFWLLHRALALALAIYFLTPTLSCLVRFGGEGSFHQSQPDLFLLWFYRGLRGALLLACLWLAFDPVCGPRQIVQSQLGLALPMLTFDYLNALGAGFLAGNLLLIALEMDPARRYSRPRIRIRRLATPVAAGTVVLLLAALAARNAPAILSLNFHPLQPFGQLAVDSLPAGRGVVLSDQPQKLEVFEAALARSPRRADWLPVDTQLLADVAYRAGLQRRSPIGWLDDETRHRLTAPEMVRLLAQIARTNRFFYLHSSYGFFFERFYLEPAGAVYEMKLRASNSLDTPAPSPASIAADEAFWNAAWQKGLAELAAETNPPSAAWPGVLDKIGLAPAPLNENKLLDGWYSFALDGWGVALQRQGLWDPARRRFEQALELNPDNFSAQISLACNTNHQSGQRVGMRDVDKVAGELGNSQRLSTVMNECGPFDEPIFCYLLGSALEQIDEPLQAVEQFERARALAPAARAPDFALAQLYLRLHAPDRARPLINHLLQDARGLPPESDVRLELDLLEADASLSQTNLAGADSRFRAILQQHPDDAQIVNRVVGAYLAFGDFNSALELLDAQMARTPDDVPGLDLQAAILIQSGKPAAAIPILDHVLALTNLPDARLNRAAARLASGEFAAAEADYRDLEQSGQENGLVSYGLAIIASHRHDTNQEVHYLRLCLTNTTPGTALWLEAGRRLKALKGPLFK